MVSLEMVSREKILKKVDQGTARIQHAGGTGAKQGAVELVAAFGRESRRPDAGRFS